VAALGYMDGDIRRALIACHIGAALLLFLTARKRGLALIESTLFALLFFYLPFGPFVAEQAWTEPSLALGFGLLSWFLAGSRQMAALWAAGLVIALKQTMIFVPPLIWGLWRSLNARQLAAMLGIAVVSYAPFVLWDAGAFFNDIVRFHSLTPFRSDGLTLSAYFVSQGGRPLPGWVSLAGLAGCASLMSISLWRLPSAGGDFTAKRVYLFFLGISCTFLITLLFSKHAFLNYFYLLQYFIVLSLVWARIADEPKRISTSGSQMTATTADKNCPDFEAANHKVANSLGPQLTTGPRMR
jgi:hypothetical protein